MFSCRSSLSSGARKLIRIDFQRFSAAFRNADVGGRSSNADFPSEFWPRIPQTEDELSEFIKKHVVWVSDDYIASAKPYDVSAYGIPWSVLRRQRRRESSGDAQSSPPFDDWEDNDDAEEYNVTDARSNLTIASIIPRLASIFDSGELSIAKTVPRYYEGPLLLARNEKARLAAMKSLHLANASSQFPMKSLCICVGVPKETAGDGWCYSKTEFISDTEGFQCTLHPTQPSQTAVKRGLMRQGYFRYRVLAYDASADVSLVEMEMKKMQHQLDRLFLLDKGCPILGDALHQKCNARILGQPVYVPHKRASIRNQYIPTGLLKKLRISLKEYHELPLFAHVHTLLMPKLLRKDGRKEDAELRAPMPSYFVSLLETFDWLRVVEEDEKRKQQEDNPITGN